MKFKCGPTAAERFDAYVFRRNWHPHFLLFPKKIGDYCYWLQTVERRGYEDHGWDGGTWEWEYRLNEK